MIEQLYTHEEYIYYYEKALLKILSLHPITTELNDLLDYYESVQNIVKPVFIKEIK